MLATPGLYARRLWAGRRVGLLGGSFNPAHEGHRHVSLALMRRLGLDAVWWLVSPQNPLKPSNGMAPFAERLAGAAAVARHPRIVATGIERALGTRFTADTLKALRRRFPETHFVWLMGADNLQQIGRWNHWTDIMKGVPIAVHGRAPYSLKAVRGKAAQRFRTARIPMRYGAALADLAPPAWIFVLTRGHPASATALREGAHHDHGPQPGPRGR